MNWANVCTWCIYVLGLLVAVPGGLILVVVAWDSLLDQYLKSFKVMQYLLAYVSCRDEFQHWLSTQGPGWWQDRTAAPPGSPVYRERDALLELTRQLEIHPEGYDGPCLCRTCEENCIC